MAPPPHEALHTMRTSRHILRSSLPRIERALRSCETVEQKKYYLGRLWEEADERGMGQSGYLAFCYGNPTEMGVLSGGDGDEEDLDALRKKQDYEYTGPWIRLHRRDSNGNRQFELDDEGNRVPVQAVQRQLFGREWSRQWQGSSRPRDTAASGEAEREDPLRVYGPKDEVTVVTVAPPLGVDGWEKLRELQGKERKMVEAARAKERKRKEREESIRLVREWLRRLRRRFSGEKRKAAVGKEMPVKKLSDAGKMETEEEKVDSGYASRQSVAT